METIHIAHGSKEEKYRALVPQIESLLGDETDLIANCANVAAALKSSFGHYSWVGVYLLKGEELVLGPFQGKIACARIMLGKGVCGTAAVKRRTQIVTDVREFPGHIACDPGSRSEIVVPLEKDQAIVGVLDVDSERIAAFDDIDRKYLERIASILMKR